MEPATTIDSLIESQSSVTLHRAAPDGLSVDLDKVAVEEPLEVRVGYTIEGRRVVKSVSVIMRTPGHDEALALGFLFSEGVIHTLGDVSDIWSERPPHDTRWDGDNIVHVELSPGVIPPEFSLQRNFYSTSSCGVCGKASLDALRANLRPYSDLNLYQPRVSISLISMLPDRLRAAQPLFEATGGVHAAGVCSTDGELRLVHEDIGRHNAVDKLIGEALRREMIPLSDMILQVSGRTSFEILQKALVAGIPIVAAVGAPSSLAVSLADEFGMTLIGFAGGESFNVYSGAQRILE